ncbi:hypothetical protein SFUMM280S_08798 [Streptomyces fumanus]
MTGWLAGQDCARLELETRLDTRDWRLCATPADLEAVLARLDLVVTDRLHGLVLALRGRHPGPGHRPGGGRREGDRPGPRLQLARAGPGRTGRRRAAGAVVGVVPHGGPGGGRAGGRGLSARGPRTRPTAWWRHWPAVFVRTSGGRGTPGGVGSFPGGITTVSIGRLSEHERRILAEVERELCRDHRLDRALRTFPAGPGPASRAWRPTAREP